MKYATVAALFVLAVTAPAFADADKPTDPAVLAVCGETTDLAVKLLQAGDKTNAKKLQPTIEKCLKVQRIELARKSSEIAAKAEALLKENEKANGH